MTSSYEVNKDSVQICKIGFGGGCHWCTEAVFQSIPQIESVRQGWIRSEAPYQSWSEAVLVCYNKKRISLDVLIQAHLLTHSSTTIHSFREKYRSAIYTFSRVQAVQASGIIKDFRSLHDKNYSTKVLPFVDFKVNRDEMLNYYKTRPEAPFCIRYILPKLEKIRSGLNQD